MFEIIIAIVIVAAIGLILGIGLSVAAVVMAVKKDEREEKVREALPGANCGACGFSGCDGYAAAVAKGEAETNLCVPGGNSVARQVSAVMGVEAAATEKKTAFVACSGNFENCGEKLSYQGVKSCAAANQHFAGIKDCSYACIGYGDCTKVCPNGAIHIANGAAVVCKDDCIGCGICAKACPKGIIGIIPASAAVKVVCSSHDKGPVAKNSCKVGCIGCGICMKKCPSGAIKVENFVAKIDYGKCTACGVCAEACPRKIISVG